MKVLLREPIEGYLEEADFRVPQKGEFYLLHHGDGPILATAKSIDYFEPRLVLTTTKKKYWRLDPVETFEEASPFELTSNYRFGKHPSEKSPRWHDRNLGANIQWLRLTEHEE